MDTSLPRRALVFTSLRVAGAALTRGDARASCSGIPIDGTCSGDTFRYCVFGLTISVDCSWFGKRCGGQHFLNYIPYHGCIDNDEDPCKGVQCGPGCGAGPTGHTESGQCEAVACEARCDGRVCDDDGCGGVCGVCLDGQSCDNGACVAGVGPDAEPNPEDESGQFEGGGGCAGGAAAGWGALVLLGLAMRRRS